MIEDSYLNRLPSKNQGSRENLVMFARLNVAVEVVVSKDNGGRVLTKCCFGNATRINRRAIDRPLLKRFHAIGEKLVGRFEIPD